MLDKNTNKSTIDYEYIDDLNLISLWLQSGSNWSSTIKEEIHACTEKPITQEESSYTNKVVLFGVLATLAILAACACSQASEIHRSVQEVGTNSFKELILER